MDWFGSSSTRQADDTETQQATSDVQQAEEAQPEASTSGSSNDGSSQQPRWRQRLVKYSIKAIQAVLLIEVAAILAYPLVSAPSKSKIRESESSEEQGFDPADILMDYFTGRRGEAACTCHPAASDYDTYIRSMWQFMARAKSRPCCHCSSRCRNTVSVPAITNHQPAPQKLFLQSSVIMTKFVCTNPCCRYHCTAAVEQQAAETGCRQPGDRGEAQPQQGIWHVSR